LRRLVYSDCARGDLNQLFEYIAHQTYSTAVALKFIDRLHQQCARLAELPGMLGRARPELGADIRSFAIQSHVIFFRYGPGTVEIINILDGHRDIDSHFTGAD
jgi:toxin ParE1/3/4